ncbi:MAG: heme exporter protein CcmD [Alphaproteobacteria bacterium]|nr:heme exporter protein CcmD [Alphaproteobacteria bacterium]
MSPLSEFLAMGGYALFVWPAMAMVAVVLGGLLFESLRQLRSAEADLAAVEDRARNGSRR